MAVIVGRVVCASVGVAVALSACGEMLEVAGRRGVAREREETVVSSAPGGGPARGPRGVAAAPDAKRSSSRSVGRFRKHKAMAHVRSLAGRIGSRLRGHRGERRAARLVARKFRRLGYRARIRKFPVDGKRSRNVVAWWRGAARYPVVLGAHMDTVRKSPGANDNASGVAVLLETARIIAGDRPARWVRFVAFGSEEYGVNGRHHVGSQRFVERLGAGGRKRLAGMVSVDMVADGRPLRIGTAGIGPRIVARAVFRRARKANVGAVYRTSCDCSDNGPFERAGIPASYMWSGPEPNYHSPSDTVANMDPRDLKRTGRAVRSFVRALDRRTIRRFRTR
jgi:aminopeptidase YwaD